MRSSLLLGITAVTGRMGRRLVALAHESGEFTLHATLMPAGHVSIGQDAGEIAGIGPIDVKVSDALDQHVDVLIDFSTPAGTRHWLRHAHHQRVPMLIGTTGLTDADHRLIDQAALDIPILQTANTSFGVALLARFASALASLMDEKIDIEIVESHHRDKKDAPSGTAKMLAQKILEAREKSAESLVLGRRGEHETRKPGTVGLHSVRMGDVPGKHTIYFCGEGETIELTHTAATRDVFVRGALRAASWLAGQGAGRYQIEDALGIDPAALARRR